MQELDSSTIRETTRPTDHSGRQLQQALSFGTLDLPTIRSLSAATIRENEAVSFLNGFVLTDDSSSTQASIVNDSVEHIKLERLLRNRNKTFDMLRKIMDKYKGSV